MGRKSRLRQKNTSFRRKKKGLFAGLANLFKLKLRRRRPEVTDGRTFRGEPLAPRIR